MKKILGYIIVVLWFLVGNMTWADTSGTTFYVPDTFFDVTSFSKNDHSTIHFGTWNTGNSFGWAIFWWPKIDKDITLKMNWHEIYCKKQIRWFYVNQARWNVMWPLDTTTLWLFKWNLAWYQNLNLNWWFFTHCTWDLITNYNGIFGYVKHTTTDWLEYELRAWVDYKMDTIWNKWWDTLGQELNIDTKDFFIKWILYDSYGGIWYIDSTFHAPLILRNSGWDDIYIDIDMTPHTSSIGWEIDYTVEFWNKFDFYLDDVKVYMIIPENIDADRDEIWDLSGNKLLLYDWDLYPLQSKKFNFKANATVEWSMITTWVINAWLVTRTDIVEWFVVNTKLIIKQSIIADTNPIMVWDRITYDITIINSGNATSTWIMLLDYLPSEFVYHDIWYPKYNNDNNIIILFTGDLAPWEYFNIKLKWYFPEWWTFKNIAEVKIPNAKAISNDRTLEVQTNVCGDWILEEEYEFCDDWDDNGKVWYCNTSCTKIIWAWIACKYTDANYLSNGPFTDTLNHRWFKYIETMRKSCLHRWKWTFAWQWKYDPDEYITKAEVIKTLVKIRWMAFNDFDIVNEDTPYDGVQVFADVSKKHWFSRYSFYAFDHGITDWLYVQNGNKKYINPDGTISRNQIIKAIMVLYKEIIDNSEIDISGKSKLADIAKWSSYYYQYVREAEELWIIWWYDMQNGTKMWLGNNPLTRAEFAKIVSIPFEQVLFESE